MLGEMIGEDKGKITTYRVVGARGGANQVEVSMKSAGKIHGIEFMELATYSSVMKQGGHLYGEGRGVFMTKDGESASWVGQGVGHFKQGGGMSWRGTVYFESASAKFAKLNGTASVFEHESDANDNTSTKFWEWK
jgi:hypothetical protein